MGQGWWWKRKDMASFYLLVPGEGAPGYRSAGGPLKKAHNFLCPRPLSFPCSLPVWFLGCQYPWCHGSSIFLSPACGWDSKLPNFKGPGKVCTHSRPYPGGEPCGALVPCCPGRTVIQLTHTQARVPVTHSGKPQLSPRLCLRKAVDRG